MFLLLIWRLIFKFQIPLSSFWGVRVLNGVSQPLSFFIFHFFFFFLGLATEPSGNRRNTHTLKCLSCTGFPSEHQTRCNKTPKMLHLMQQHRLLLVCKNGNKHIVAPFFNKIGFSPPEGMCGEFWAAEADVAERGRFLEINGSAWYFLYIPSSQERLPPFWIYTRCTWTL